MIKMNNKQRYIFRLITEQLNESYGDTLHEGDTDLEMATSAYKKVSKFLDLNKVKKGMTVKEFQLWKKYRHNDMIEQSYPLPSKILKELSKIGVKPY